MKLTLSRIRVEPVQVEVPEVCPHCGADFRTHGALWDEGWIGCRDRCRIADSTEGPYLNDYTDSADLADVRLSVGLTCASCRETVATTEEQEKPDGQLPS